MDRAAKPQPDAESTELPPAPAGGVSRHAAVAHVGHAALLGLGVTEVFDLAVGLVCDVLDVEYAEILHQPSPGEPLVLVSGRGWGDHVGVGVTTVPPDHSQAGYTLKSHEPVLVEDLAREQRFAGTSLLTDHDVVSGMSVIIPDQDRPYGVFGVHTRRRRSFTADDGDFLRSFANMIGGAVQSDSTRRENERRLRYEAALAQCARTLLVGTGENRLEEAVEALLSATQATYVVVERNVMDPELGLCCQIVADAEKPGAQDYGQGTDYWQLVPWDRMPTSRQKLEEGRPFFLIPEQLTGIEYDQYAADPYPVKSELDIPIFVDGQWEGLIEFTDSEVVRDWTEEEVSLLVTAASLIGAFWEREAAREGLQQLNRQKDAFLASVSHELRTPITAVVGFSQVLRDTVHTMSEEERTELLEMLVAQGADLASITNDLLVAAKGDIGSLEVTSVLVDLHTQSLKVLEAFPGDRVAEIELVGSSVQVVGDPDRIRQIVRNLLTNALRYGGDRIWIQVISSATTAKVLVCDNGPAIPEEDRERIFQRYQRAHNTRGVADSLGLGLVISRQLAHLMGGDLTYRHQDGESIFELALRCGG